MTRNYIFLVTQLVLEETQVEAKSYDEAVDIFLSGGGVTYEVDANGGDWECIDNPDELKEEEA